MSQNATRIILVLVDKSNITYCPLTLIRLDLLIYYEN